MKNEKQHPDQIIQEEWIIFLNQGPLTPERYRDFINWRDEFLKPFR